MQTTQRSKLTEPKAAQRDRIDELAFQGGLELEDAKAHHDGLLRDINRDISRFTDGGMLIPAPYCPSACQPGSLADFLITLRINPFSRINMFYCASDLQTALYLDTCIYDPEFVGRCDAEICGYYQSKMQLWSDFKRNEPEADFQFVRDMRDAILAEVSAEMAEIEAILHGDHGHGWRSYFVKAVSQAA